jgi:hypothetical protein
MSEAVEEISGTNALPIAALPPILSVAKAAEILTLSDETVCAFIRRGELRASGLGTDKKGTPCRPYAVQAEDLLAFLRQRLLGQAAEAGQAAPSTPPDEGHGRRRRQGTSRRKVAAPVKLVSPRSPR